MLNCWLNVESRGASWCWCCPHPAATLQGTALPQAVVKLVAYAAAEPSPVSLLLSRAKVVSSDSWAHSTGTVPAQHTMVAS